jgi:hypothetical protein
MRRELQKLMSVIQEKDATIEALELQLRENNKDNKRFIGTHHIN